jgi:hypothetical protein
MIKTRLWPSDPKPEADAGVPMSGRAFPSSPSPTTAPVPSSPPPAAVPSGPWEIWIENSWGDSWEFCCINRKSDLWVGNPMRTQGLKEIKCSGIHLAAHFHRPGQQHVGSQSNNQSGGFTGPTSQGGTSCPLVDKADTFFGIKAQTYPWWKSGGEQLRKQLEETVKLLKEISADRGVVKIPR